MTRQEAFNIVWEYLTAPDAVQCWDANAHQCLYTAYVDGKLRHCAVGVLLTPDEQQMVADYQGSVQGLIQTWNELEIADLAADPGGLEFLDQLQAIHDNGDNWTGAREGGLGPLSEGGCDALLDFADKWGLSVPAESPAGGS